MLEKRLLDILACPVCKGNLIYKLKPESLSCRHCRVIYPVEKGIPNLLPPVNQKPRRKKS